MATYAEMFKEAETDADGFLSLDQFTTLFKKQNPGASDRIIPTIFQDTDANRNGKTSFAEFQHAMTPKAER
ncbi:EF-hand domain-containing protein [Ralstonia sp. R-29]|uniref:EF-hand domain-containing protein n=1 Tax=Ralstonia sp. R-29 TaxID=3404059 RepID=UPI003CF48034